MIYSKILKSKPVKTFFIGILRSCCILFFKLHLAIILSWLLRVNLYIDFFIQIFINICLSLYVEQIFSFIPYDAEIFNEIITDVIDNYANRIWMKQLKTLCVLGACTYLAIVLCIITINNTILMTSIIQYLIAFFIMEYAELLPYMYNRYFNKPIVLHSDKINLINSYLPHVPHENVPSNSLTQSIIME